MILSSKLSVLGLLLVSIFLLAAILYVRYRRQDHPIQSVRREPPDCQPTTGLNSHFGTDFQGRDIFSRVIAALPTDLGIPILVVLLSSLIGLLLGSWLDIIVA